jgi:hypothetical protein
MGAVIVRPALNVAENTALSIDAKGLAVSIGCLTLIESCHESLQEGDLRHVV